MWRLQGSMGAFDQAWAVVKQQRWADAFRSWAKSNIDSEWYDSEYGIGSAERPELGFNFDEWDYKILETLGNAFEEMGVDIDEDDFDDMKESISEQTWFMATNEINHPMEAVEQAIRMINRLAGGEL